MTADLSLISSRFMPRKYGLVLILVKCIIWHSYICICYPGSIGVNCTGCIGDPCKNNGTCNDTGSGYTCSCLSGFAGQNCTQGTTLNLNGSTQWSLNSSARYIEFSFRTTLKAGLILQIATSSSNLFLTLSDQGLSLLTNSGSSELNITGTFSDGAWHNLSLSISDKSLNFTADSKKAIVFISVPTITSYYLGTVHSSSETIKTAASPYVGCMKDLQIGGMFKIPDTDGSLVGGTVGSCTWQNLCSSPKNPCQNSGNCTDLWNDFKCQCPTGFSGKDCSHTTCAGNPCSKDTSCVNVHSGNAICISPYTLAGSTSNLVFRNITASNYSYMQFSLLTQSSNGLVLASVSNSSHFLAIGLNEGKIVIVYRYWFMTSEEREQRVTKINDGQWHNIKITNPTILNSHFKTSLDKDGVTVGNNTRPYLASLFSVNHFTGCFQKLLLGADLIQHSFKMGVSVGCDACASSPCVRGACVNTSTGYRCNCPQFYSGVNCNSTHNISCGFKQNLCHTSNCQNLSVPVNAEYSQSGKDFFKCNCTRGYTGYLCTTVVNNCSPNPCVNGKCTSSIGDYTCNCTTGFSGKNCNVNINECSSNPCKNGGNCQDNVNGFVCTCTSGYKGDTCQTSESKTNVAMWVGISIAILAAILVIVFCIVRYCVGSSGLSGSYSPTGQEKGQVQMTSMPPMQPKERLI